MTPSPVYGETLMIQCPKSLWLACLTTLVLCIGCTSAPSPPGKPVDKAVSEDSEAGKAKPSGTSDSTAAKPAADPGSERLEPFDPPPLEELDAKAKWED